MGRSKGLYSRTRPSASAPKEIRGFLALSGELRNQTYQYYFDVGFRCELVAEHHQFQFTSPEKTVKLWPGGFDATTKPLLYTSESKDEACAPISLRVSRPLGKYNQVEALKTKWATSLSALPLTCRQIFNETLVLLYHATVFVSAAPARLYKLLSTAKLGLIAKLELHYETYGDPEWAQDIIWQEKHHDSWVRACEAASKKLNLNVLKIHILVGSVVPRLNLREAWLAPLLQFRRLNRARSASAQLTTVEIDFRTHLLQRPSIDHWDFKAANQDLHRLFGMAIRDAILGEAEETAMKAFVEKWEGEYEGWQWAFEFAPTGGR